MNVILLGPDELAADGTARLTGRRARHVAEVLRPSLGASLRVGVLGGRMGRGEVAALGSAEVVLRVALDSDPPPRSPVDLLLALPRPKALRRVLQATASMGIGRLVLLGSYRVEKSYFSTPLLSAASLSRELALGLEQARDTIPPQVLVRRWFKPFVEDELDALFPAGARLLAAPAAQETIDALPPAPRALLAVGPEGGFTPYEQEELARRRFAPFSLGPRALRVETAVPHAVGQVELWPRLARPAAARDPATPSR